MAHQPRPALRTPASPPPHEEIGSRTEATPESGEYRTDSGLVVAWHVRRSTRAKHPRLTVSPRKGIEVVLPASSHADPLELLAESAAWLDRTCRKVEPARESYQRSQAMPETVELPVSDEAWRVVLRHGNGSSVRARADVGLGVLTLSGDVNDDEAVRRALRRFVRLRASDVLPRLLALVARDAGISYRSCRISSARTRWGSCSQNGQIMLSDRTMFLPQPLAIHVCQHELAHIRHFDHGREFHELLGQLDPEAEQHGWLLAHEAMVLVPAWMDAPSAR